jgi:hypothetical protein
MLKKTADRDAKAKPVKTRPSSAGDKTGTLGSKQAFMVPFESFVRRPIK